MNISEKSNFLRKVIMILFSFFMSVAFYPLITFLVLSERIVYLVIEFIPIKLHQYIYQYDQNFAKDVILKFQNLNRQRLGEVQLNSVEKIGDLLLKYF